VQHISEKNNSTKAIVKTVDLSRASQKERDDAVKEAWVLSSLKHPYIVKYREGFYEDGWLCIVMDYAEGGDLYAKIKMMHKKGDRFPQDQILLWFTQSILALKYIHEQHILHRDLKSNNFFLSKAGNIKLGDFGIAKVLECTAAVAQTQIGTPYYLSPELCSGKAYNWAADIWAMGCILYEMAATKRPFEGSDLGALIQKITKGPLPEMPAEYPDERMRSLLKELLYRDPMIRPPAAEILKRPIVLEMVERMKKKEESSSQPKGVQKTFSTTSTSSFSAESAEGKYAKGDVVEFYSQTHKEWMVAEVTDADQQGRIMVNLKPNVWLTLEAQRTRVRPHRAGGAKDKTKLEEVV
jgi:NIMA (never in mitosis gene a)-related kinase